MTRALLFSIALGLVPVLVVAGPASPAAAATVATGPTVTGKWSDDPTYAPGDSYACSVTGYTRLHDTGLYSVRATLRCTFGWNFYQSDRLDVTAYGSGGGERCTFRAEAIDMSEDEESDREVTLTARLVSETSVDPACVLTSGTYTHYAETSPGGFGEPQSDTFGWALGAMPAVVGDDESAADNGCNLYKLTKRPRLISQSIVAHPPLGSYTGRPAKQFKLSWSGEWRSLNGYSPNSTMWVQSLLVVENADGTLRNMAVPNSDGPKRTEHFYDKTRWMNPQITNPAVIDAISTPNDSYVIGGEFPKIVGIAVAVGGATPQQMGSTNGGVGYSNGCNFYYGKKFVNNDTTTLDDPLGTLNIGEAGTGPAPTGDTDPLDNPAPTSPESGCEGFSFSDPTTWAGAGICVMVKAVLALLELISDVLNLLVDLAAAIAAGFMSVVDAVAGIAGAIVDGLVTAFDWLFIPEPGFITAQIEDTQSSWVNTPPGEIATTTAVLSETLTTPPDGTGCLGPAVTLTLPLTDASTTIHPVAACSGGKLWLANMSKLVLMVLVYVAGAIVGMRVLLSSVGLNVPIGGDKE